MTSALSSGIEGEVEHLTMRCTSCGAEQTQAVDANATVRQVLAEAECLFCRRVGAMQRAKRAS